MYQSVMAQRQGSGSSGVGYSFDLVTIKELLPDKNICLAENKQYGSQYQLGLDKRGMLAWPQTGDVWVIDRSLGHWALRSKVTGTAAPNYTGFSNLMDPDVYQLVQLLAGHGLLADQTTPNGVEPTPPAFTGSKNNLSPGLQQLLTLLDDQGILDDQTTAQTVPVGVWQLVGASGKPAFVSPWTNYDATTYTPARYMIDEKGTVELEGLVKTTAATSGPSPIFVLPTGFRPQLVQVRDSYRNGALAQQLEIAPDGTVRAANFSSATIGFMTLACRFSTL